MLTKKEDKKVIIIGGGPAGLTAAYELNKSGIRSEVFEKDDIRLHLERVCLHYKNLFLIKNQKHRQKKYQTYLILL